MKECVWNEFQHHTCPAGLLCFALSLVAYNRVRPGRERRKKDDPHNVYVCPVEESVGLDGQRSANAQLPNPP